MMGLRLCSASGGFGDTIVANQLFQLINVGGDLGQFDVFIGLVGLIDAAGAPDQGVQA